MNRNRWYPVTVATSDPNRVRYIFRRTHSLYPGTDDNDPPSWRCRDDWLAMREYRNRGSYYDRRQHANDLKRAIRRRLGFRGFARKLAA